MIGDLNLKEKIAYFIIGAAITIPTVSIIVFIVCMIVVFNEMFWFFITCLFIIAIISAFVIVIYGIGYFIMNPEEKKDSPNRYQTGYRCFLTVTERGKMQRLLIVRIKELTVEAKEARIDDLFTDTFMQHIQTRKRQYAKIIAKLEQLYPYKV